MSLEKRVGWGKKIDEYNSNKKNNELTDISQNKSIFEKIEIGHNFLGTFRRKYTNFQKSWNWAKFLTIFMYQFLKKRFFLWILTKKNVCFFRTKLLTKSTIFLKLTCRILVFMKFLTVFVELKQNFAQKLDNFFKLEICHRMLEKCLFVSSFCSCTIQLKKCSKFCQNSMKNMKLSVFVQFLSRTLKNFFQYFVEISKAYNKSNFVHKFVQFCQKNNKIGNICHRLSYIG